MSDVIDLARARRQRKRREEEQRGEAWEDESMTVTVQHDPDWPNHPTIRTETDGFICEYSLTPEEARVFAYRLLNIANAPRGVALRGHAKGEDE